MCERLANSIFTKRSGPAGFIDGAVGWGKPTYRTASMKSWKMSTPAVHFMMKYAQPIAAGIEVANASKLKVTWVANFALLRRRRFQFAFVLITGISIFFPFFTEQNHPKYYYLLLLSFLSKIHFCSVVSGKPCLFNARSGLRFLIFCICQPQVSQNVLTFRFFLWLNPLQRTISFIFFLEKCSLRISMSDCFCCSGVLYFISSP